VKKQIYPKEKIPKPANLFKHTVHIGPIKWTYIVGRRIIKIRSPLGHITSITQAKFFNVTPDEIDRARYKGIGYQVTPSLIESYILENLI
jgi:hypothetical protein